MRIESKYVDNLSMRSSLLPLVGNSTELKAARNRRLIDFYTMNITQDLPDVPCLNLLYSNLILVDPNSS